MSRWLALMCAAALVGCQAAPPVIDPFQSQQRVPPPGTGDITPIQPGMVGVPSGQPAPPAVTTPGNGYVPPAGSFNYGNGTGSIYANPSAGSPNNGAAPYGASGYGQPNYGAPATPQPTYGAPRPTTPVYPTPPGGANPYPAQPGGGSIYNNRQSSFDRSVGAPAPRSAASGTMTVARIGANRDLDPRDATVPKAMQNKPEIDVGQIVQAGYEAADVDRRQPTRDEMPAAGEPSRRSEAPVA